MDQERKTGRKEPKLHVAEPCPKRWEELEGSERKRFCGACQLHVYNSEAMTPREVTELAATAEGRVCMRVVKDPDGRTRFKETSRARVAGWALAAGSGALSACDAEGTRPEGPEVTPVPPVHEQPVEQGPGVELLGEGEILMGAVPVEVLGDAVIEPEQPTDPECTLSGDELLSTLGEVYFESVPEGALEPCDDPDPAVPEPEMLGRIAYEPPAADPPEER